eukprot:TRINITY_DN9077_c0_g1_i1.p1 TRINITY_DN9077_c0_g1~~TRINITY_DN9077_c0_g1_i1.p1  ORF type:complete len:224 (-),score=85.26 TRINITY_DN9077_c0_g1_i1:96-767(-)
MHKKYSIYSTILLKYDEANPTKIYEFYQLSDFPLLKKERAKEACSAASKVVVARAPKGDMMTVNGLPATEKMPLDGMVMHVKVRNDNLAIAIITSEGYPSRIAMDLMFKLEDAFKKLGNEWQSITEDKSINFADGKDLSIKYNNPQDNDKIMKIQQEIKETKTILNKAIGDLLKRGEKLDDLLEQTEELEASSKQFYTQSEQVNRCCNFCCYGACSCLSCTIF